MKTENLSTLKIYKLTQEQYERKLANGEIDPNALYFTDDEDAGSGSGSGGNITEDQLNGKADVEHTHIVSDITDLQTVIDTINNDIGQKSQVQIIESGDAAEVLSTLKIHKLTKAEYDEKAAAGEIDENALYFTLDESVNLDDYATLGDIENKSDVGHKHEMSDITNLNTTLDALLEESKSYIDDVVSNMSGAEHNHDDIYYTETEIDNKISDLTEEVNQYASAGDESTLAASKTYTDEAVAQKSQVQIIIWGADD